MASILYRRQDIQSVIKWIRCRIQTTRLRLADHPLTVIGNLNGCLFFMADLLKGGLEADQVGFCQTSAYQRLYPKPQEVFPLLKMEPNVQFEGHHVILVDDVLDTGRSLEQLIDFCRHGKAHLVETCVLLAKPARGKAGLVPNYVGFPYCPDVFLYGYGMDYQGKKRELSDIWMLDEDETNKLR